MFSQLLFRSRWPYQNWGKTQIDAFCSENGTQLRRLESISRNFNPQNSFKPTSFPFSTSPEHVQAESPKVPAQIAALAADNDDDMALGVARRKKGPVPKLLSNEKCKGTYLLAVG